MKKLLGIVVLSLLFCNTVLALPKCVGEDTSKWTMCEGTKIFDSGLTYVGEWKDGKRHGKGTGSYPDGSNYVGEYKDDKANGLGTMVNYFDGDVIIYQGNFKDSFIENKSSINNVSYLAKFNFYSVAKFFKKQKIIML